MAWDHLSITNPHLVYIILGGFTSLFMLCSSVIKERMYIGEATVATLCGVIFGPHAAGLIDPASWGSVDIVTIEFSRIVLVVQCFAVGVELPKFYMERHWKSVFFLLVPVMTFGWLVTSVFIWWLIEPLSWLESLVVAACVTATDPVLASSVVGKGKFAKRVPKHLRDLLSAESGCNDGMAFPFIYLALYLIQDHQSAQKVSYHWIVYTILYECVFGAVFGFLVGYLARHGIKFAEKRELIDRESFLVFYFVLALFCAGSGSILGLDDLLVGFACGVGFSNDGWFTQKTEESHVSNVIDLLLNLTYFVYFGTIIPWEMYNDYDMGLSAWRLAVLAIFVLLFRRVPIMMALKPLIPDIKTWREALFAGHFGPVGVGAIFVAILARAELEVEKTIPLAVLPPEGSENYVLLTLVWPIVTFLVVASIIVHGSSIAVFTLGKHINTLTITMSYTQAGEDGPSWMNRLPRISSQSRSQARTTDTDVEELKLPDFPPGTLPPIGLPGHFLRRVHDEDNSTTKQGSRASSLSGRRKRKKWDDGIGPGGPITQSAIFPQRRGPGEQGTLPSGGVADQTRSEQQDPAMLSPSDASKAYRQREKDQQKARVSSEEPSQEDISPDDTTSPGGAPRGQEIEVYDEGDHVVIENEDGDVLAVESSFGEDNEKHAEKLKSKLRAEGGPSGWSIDSLKKRLTNWREEEIEKRKEKEKTTRRSEPARAYQFGTTIIVENEDGEVVKKYELPTQKQEGGPDFVSQGLKYMGMGGRANKTGEKLPATGGPSSEGDSAAASAPSTRPTLPSWASGAFTRKDAGESSTPKNRKKSVVEEQEEEDDRHIRFTIGGVGQRLTKEDFIKKMQKLDVGTRREIIDQSNASHTVKVLAKQDPKPKQQGESSRAQDSKEKLSASPNVSQQDDNAAGTSEQGSGSRSRSRSRSPSRSLSRSISRSPSPDANQKLPDAPSRDAPETAVERRRRLAVLKSVGDAGDEEDTGETAAERRRREAALGVSSTAAAAEDSDDDDTPRVPPPKRGIRFADVPAKGKE
ncbi:alkali metal cation/H+ antiporter Nha1 C terminus-domain-containing protein [Podospora didyma]|uniref:Alkali metal cation/H+ antiporter Nha1 C terminus-domain-containing protein n=1 Tax=Podospora didyma TaxID=330526 RepID=A0AAE0N8R4_9PEZI|nr:alkali metal cation/H+ antiporter Nha1 C terminus-domain-containing protein [Podospora didyma]